MSEIQLIEAPEPSPERWLPVVGWEGVYEVSDLGRVRRATAKRRGAVRRLFPNRLGYEHVILCDAGARKSCAVHRLVMAAFTGPCPTGFHVNHKNGKPGDNRLENLEYVTPRENILHARDVLGRRFGRFYGHAKGEARRPLTDEEKAEIRARYAACPMAHVRSALAREFDATVATIRSVVGWRPWRVAPRR